MREGGVTHGSETVGSQLTKENQAIHCSALELGLE